MKDIKKRLMFVTDMEYKAFFQAAKNESATQTTHVIVQTVAEHQSMLSSALLES